MGAVCCKESQGRNEGEVSLGRDQQFFDSPEHEKTNPEIVPKSDDKKESSRGFQLVSQWKISTNGSETVIPIDNLSFSYTNCQFTAQGADAQGKFRIIGNFTLSGDVMIKMLYESTALLNKSFDGKFQEDAIVGEWSDGQNSKGDFRLELVTQVWHSSDTFVAMKSLQEYVGYGKFPYGYGIFSGTPKSEDCVHLDIIFGDGKTGTFDFTVGQEVIKGKTQSPAGEHELFLTASNNFA